MDVTCQISNGFPTNFMKRTLKLMPSSLYHGWLGTKWVYFLITMHWQWTGHAWFCFLAWLGKRSTKINTKTKETGTPRKIPSIIPEVILIGSREFKECQFLALGKLMRGFGASKKCACKCREKVYDANRIF